ncbi:TetR/AcrR family transcriptional regulator [Methylonatrum kenyense]|uniref:TetR/AcrR family transcriptional regulator n=1 Tax=Methylonatrum kenyense TaxID=455253 RepID=UPI0020BD9DEF|nr:TetR/AcrR family transcriptional regulator [Methylonatrum kenyense]
MSAARSTRKRILDAAAELFQRRGFSGFSYQHIAAQLGVRNAAIHYHFPSKADLGVALLSRYRDSFRWWTEQVERQGLTPAQKVARFLELESRYCLEGKVCPLGVVCVEFENVTQAVQAEAAGLAADLETWLAAVLEEGRRAQDIRLEGASRAVAVAILAQLQGGLQLARLRGSRHFQDVLQQVRDGLGISSAGLLVAAS